MATGSNPIPGKEGSVNRPDVSWSGTGSFAHYSQDAYTIPANAEMP
jgi:hypothetical protein